MFRPTYFRFTVHGKPTGCYESDAKSLRSLYNVRSTLFVRSQSVTTCLLFVSNYAVGNQDSARNLPYTFGPSNSWNVSSSYLSPYDWLFGAFAPPFWADNFEAMALSEVRYSRNKRHDGGPPRLAHSEL